MDKVSIALRQGLLLVLKVNLLEGFYMEGDRGCRLAFEGSEYRAKMLICEGSLQEDTSRRGHF